MPETKPAKAFTKSRLVKELSWTCQLPQTKIKEILESLVAITKREAGATFVLPGLCKFEVVRRKPRKVRFLRVMGLFWFVVFIECLWVFVCSCFKFPSSRRRGTRQRETRGAPSARLKG